MGENNLQPYTQNRSINDNIHKALDIVRHKDKVPPETHEIDKCTKYQFDDYQRDEDTYYSRFD